MKKSKRFIISLISGVALLFLAFYSTFKSLETIALTSIGGIMTILSTYVWGETKRPSNEN